MHDESFGYTEALMRALIPPKPRPHSPFFGCPCEGCVKVRADIREHGFRADGQIAYPRAKKTLPWEGEIAA